MTTLSACWRIFAIVAPLALSACGYAPPPCTMPVGPDKAYVVSGNWHSEIAIPVAELDDGLDTIAARFPGARAVLFGYGKKSFMLAPPGDLGKYLSGPWPGQAAIEVTALTVDPEDAYPPENIVTLTVPADGAHRLSSFIRGDMTDNADGSPLIVAQSQDPDDVFYAANSRYDFLHTCNGWIAEALEHSGVSISSSRVVTSDRLMNRAREAGTRCLAPTNVKEN